MMYKPKLFTGYNIKGQKSVIFLAEDGGLYYGFQIRYPDKVRPTMVMEKDYDKDFSSGYISEFSLDEITMESKRNLINGVFETWQ